MIWGGNTTLNLIKTKHSKPHLLQNSSDFNPDFIQAVLHYLTAVKSYLISMYKIKRSLHYEANMYKWSFFLCVSLSVLSLLFAFLADLLPHLFVSIFSVCLQFQRRTIKWRCWLACQQWLGFLYSCSSLPHPTTCVKRPGHNDIWHLFQNSKKKRENLKSFLKRKGWFCLKNDTYKDFCMYITV